MPLQSSAAFSQLALCFPKATPATSQIMLLAMIYQPVSPGSALLFALHSKLTSRSFSPLLSHSAHSAPRCAVPPSLVFIWISLLFTLPLGMLYLHWEAPPEMRLPLFFCWLLPVLSLCHCLLFLLMTMWCLWHFCTHMFWVNASPTRSINGGKK